MPHRTSSARLPGSDVPRNPLFSFSDQQKSHSTLRPKTDNGGDSRDENAAAVERKLQPACGEDCRLRSQRSALDCRRLSAPVASSKQYISRSQPDYLRGVRSPSDPEPALLNFSLSTDFLFAAGCGNRT